MKGFTIFSLILFGIIIIITSICWSTTDTIISKPGYGVQVDTNYRVVLKKFRQDTIIVYLIHTK